MLVCMCRDRSYAATLIRFRGLEFCPVDFFAAVSEKLVLRSGGVPL